MQPPRDVKEINRGSPNSGGIFGGSLEIRSSDKGDLHVENVYFPLANSALSVTYTYWVVNNKQKGTSPDKWAMSRFDKG